MPQPRHLARAPITEAIIDYRVKARPEFRAEDFGAVRDHITARFPKVEERRGRTVSFKVGVPGSVQTQDLGLQGLFFKTADDKEIAQFRVDGLTLNRLKPYTSWSDLYPRARDLWSLYASVAQPLAITRLAVRYINHVPLPSSVSDFDEYLRAAPPIPPELPQTLSAFLSRVTVHEPEFGLAAHVSQALEIGADGRQATVIVDIDAFRASDLEPQAASIDETFDRLHGFKNHIFFNLLTETALRSFE